MKAQFIAGPWHIGMKPGPMIYGPQGEQVADLTARMVPDDETSGNAALIASAPDLLAVCEKIKAHGTISATWIDELDAAIAKARGQ